MNKTSTGIKGFDEITNGGIPRNKTTIIAGAAGCGKTVMSLEFLVRGATDYNEPGVYFSFEETEDDLKNNARSFGFDLEKLISDNKIFIEFLEINDDDLNTSGNYNLDGLFVRLEKAIKKTSAKRVVLDSLDTLFNRLKVFILRKEISRLFKWLKSKDITSLVTSESSSDSITERKFEYFLAEAVIGLDNRVVNQVATRRLRIVKMRGALHGNNEYPFIINQRGFSVLPLVSELIDYKLSTGKVTSGIEDLDTMLGGAGFLQGTSILISGSAGTGKTSIAVSMVTANCLLKRRCLYCAFEESTSQVVRNMTSIGQYLKPHLDSGLLKFYVSRPTIQNFELHIISIKKIIEEFRPDIIVLDPVTNMMSEGINSEIRQMLTQFVDYLKVQHITTFFTAAITLETIKSNPSDEGISAMMDTWVLVRDIEENSERNRGIYVLKSRGISHSTQVREFVISEVGVTLIPTYYGSEGILTGSAKLEHKLKVEEEARIRSETNEKNQKQQSSRIKLMEDGVEILKSMLQAQIGSSKDDSKDADMKVGRLENDHATIIQARNKTRVGTGKKQVKKTEGH